MNYIKIAERLMNYKLSKGENIPDSTGASPSWPDIYGWGGDHEENKQAFMKSLEKNVKMRHSNNSFVRYLSRHKSNKVASINNKIARRLISYKMQSGEELPDHTSSGDLYGSDELRDEVEDKAIWTRKLEKIISMRHSRVGLVRRLSRIKESKSDFDTDSNGIDNYAF